MKRRVVVTGLGVVSSIGIGWQAFWKALLAGQSGIRRISTFDTTEYPTHYGGEVSGFDPLQFMGSDVARHLGRGTQFALSAAGMALDDATLGPNARRQMKIGVCLGTTMADIQALEAINEQWVRSGDERQLSASLFPKYPSCTMSTNVAKYLGLVGPNFMIPTACSAGNHAISYAVDLLRLGKADAVIAGGSDPFSRIAFTGFNRLFALAPERCQPFDKNRQGTMIGEGAGVMVLETLESAQARGATPYAEVLGYGLTCDGSHMTIPDVEGVKQVIRNALIDSGITPKDVNYVSAHGTGTLANDRTECDALRAIFGSDLDSIPVSSIKSMLGHTMGAASALEAIACVLSISQGNIPPTINFETPDPECNIDCVPNHGRKQTTKVAMNNSFAFGGNNVCVVMRCCKDW